MSNSQATDSSYRDQRAQRRAYARQVVVEPDAVVPPAVRAFQRSTSEDTYASLEPARRTRANTTAVAISGASAPSIESSSAAKRSSRSPHDSVGKKARTHEAARTYNLRSTSRSIHANVPTVTPALARHIDFGQVVLKSVSSIEGRDKKLPPGVVDIFPSTNVYGPCSHMFDSSHDSAIVFHHIQKYGREYSEHVRALEAVQQRDVALRRVVLQSASSSARSSLSADDSSSDDDELDEHEKDDADDEDVRPGTPVPGTRLRYRPNALLDRGEGAAPDDDSAPLPRQPLLTASMRMILVDWLVQVAQQYAISAPAFHLGITLLDMILARGPSSEEYEYMLELDEFPPPEECFLVRPVEFQVLGCACLWIASKLEDKDQPLQDDLVYIADFSFTKSHLRQFEASICKTLAFRLQRVTPMHFVNNFLRASFGCPARSCEYDHPVLRQVVLYLLELARLQITLSARPPSLLTAAAVFLGRATLGMRESHQHHRIDDKGYWTKTLEYETGYSFQALFSTVQALYTCQVMAEGSSVRASYRKYASLVFERASLRTVPLPESLGIPLANYEDMLLH